MKRIKLEQALRDALQDNVRVTEELHDAQELVRRLNGEVEEMRKHWRPVPIAHEWQPKNPQCALCDEPRDSPRHHLAAREALRLGLDPE